MFGTLVTLVLPATARNIDQAWSQAGLFHLSTLIIDSATKISPRNVADVQQVKSLKEDAVWQVCTAIIDLYMIDHYLC